MTKAPGRHDDTRQVIAEELDRTWSLPELGANHNLAAGGYGANFGDPGSSSSKRRTVH